MFISIKSLFKPKKQNAGRGVSVAQGWQTPRQRREDIEKIIPLKGYGNLDAGLCLIKEYQSLSKGYYAAPGDKVALSSDSCALLLIVAFRHMSEKKMSRDELKRAIFERADKCGIMAGDDISQALDQAYELFSSLQAQKTPLRSSQGNKQAPSIR